MTAATDMSVAQSAPEAPDSPMRRAWLRLRRRKGAMIALGVLLLITLAAIFAPWIAPYDPAKQSWSAVRKAPSALYWFGTDEVGRDLFSRVVYGARDEKGGAVESGVRFFEQPTCHSKPEVTGGVMAEEAGILLKDFFKARR